MPPATLARSLLVAELCLTAARTYDPIESDAPSLEDEAAGYGAAHGVTRAEVAAALDRPLRELLGGGPVKARPGPVASAP